MRARANACNVNEIKKALDEKEKQVASMLTERDMQQDELVRVSAQIMGMYILGCVKDINITIRTYQQN